LETIGPKAFMAALNDDPDVVLVVAHGEGGQLPLARTKSGTMRLSTDSEGSLVVDADLDRSDPDVQAIIPKLRRGDLSEMSFSLVSRDSQWDSLEDGRSTRLIRSLSLARGDVSLVARGANPTTSATLRKQSRAVIPDYTPRARMELEQMAARAAATGGEYRRRTRAMTTRALSTRTVTRLLPVEQRADKYTQGEIDQLGAKGHAFKNADGHYSYPIADEDDLRRAVKAVGRGNASHKSIRLYIIRRAKALGLARLLPGSWAGDGSLRPGA
jgi:HK97 family phage prohead protease